MEVLNDFDTTVKKAFDEIDPNWKDYDGLVVCGTHRPHDVEEMICKIKEVRILGRPFLGICFGHQLAAIEYARNVLGNRGATSEEFNEVGDFVVKRRTSGLKVGLHNGESWWNNYEVVKGFNSIWKKSDNFITVQYHPEYQSSKEKSHPILVKFLKICKKQYTAVGRQA